MPRVTLDLTPAELDALASVAELAMEASSDPAVRRAAERLGRAIEVAAAPTFGAVPGRAAATTRAKKPSAKPAPRASPPSVRAARASVEDFVRDVYAAAERGPWWDDVRIFVSSVWEVLRRQAPYNTWSLDEFKARLLEAKGRGVELGRAELPQSMDPAALAASRIEDRNTVFVFIKRPWKAPATPVGGGSLRARVRDVYFRLTHGRSKERVRLADLRRELADVPRVKLDEVLVALATSEVIALFPIDNRRDLFPEDERAALNLAGVPQHVMYWDR